MNKVLVLLRPQHAYLNSGGSLYLGRVSADPYKEALRAALTSWKDSGGVVLSVLDFRSPEDKFYSTHKSACFVGTQDVKILDFVGVACGSNIVKSTRPDAVQVSPIAGMIKRLDPSDIAVCGVGTETAVMLTAYSLKAGYFGDIVRVVEPLCLSSDPYLHSSAISIMADAMGLEVSSEL